jgi:hypothetical protein
LHQEDFVDQDAVLPGTIRGPDMLDCTPDFWLATFRRKNTLSEIGPVKQHSTDMVFRGDFAGVHSRKREECAVPA